ncbi:phosphoadenosine phosphosulfate reductase family protein [Vibrio tubiashii]|uniref:phosphoadenosine phosphosulfate reductase domain-containing protein n=1 Tax=Vibrio tubiashii TaxID=29498 RepID=UPI001EFE91FB|nr:phosphoadenosine phosphosulfate reductase family protein [Vibrio tubiashii]MCG9575411.1 phosphoadenosine phosphosulfate reductase family protein [Vibrio tubiashii]
MLSNTMRVDSNTGTLGEAIDTHQPVTSQSLFEHFSNAVDAVDVTSTVNRQQSEKYRIIKAQFCDEVERLVSLLLNTPTTFLVAASLGKDSMIVLLMALEAYKVCKQRNPKFNKILVVNTVDTTQEEIPLQMYVDYTIPQIKSYAKRHGINLKYNLIQPTPLNRFLYRYVGARKLVNNATRNGDCTDLFKLAPAAKQYKLDKHILGGCVTNLVGSRTTESARRSSNMKSQQIHQRTTEDVTKLHQSGETTVAYAPIRDWTFEDVFGALHISGDDALIKYGGTPIPSFQPHAGLLIEIYGDAATPETCSVNGTGETDSGNVCGSSNPNRMGCTLCTIVTENKSGSSFAEKPRWKALHIDKGLRIRDYLFRLSMSENSRAFHARSIDPVLNRVVLQENTLTVRLVERIYRLLCQLSKDSLDTADHIRESGVHNFEGYLDIKNDPYMNPKTKSEFLKMYAQQACKQQYRFVTQKDAVLLSYIWALDGVASLPYSPIAMFDEIFFRNKRVPYPKLNAEMDYPVKLKSRPMGEAFVLDTMCKEYRDNEYVDIPIQEIYGMQDNWSWLSETCSYMHQPKHRLDIKIYFTPTVNETDCTIDVELHKVSIPSLGRVYDSKRFAAITEELERECIERCEGLIQRYRQPCTKVNIPHFSEKVSAVLNEKNFASNGITSQLRDLEVIHLNSLPNRRARKADTRHVNESTKRVRRNGKMATTRLRFYPPRVKSKLTSIHEADTPVLLPNVQRQQDFDAYVHNETSWDHVPLDQIFIDTEIYELYWLDLDGWERACSTYYSTRDARIKHRKTTRFYLGGQVLREMANCGGITVAPHHRKELERIRTRTDVLTQLNAYKYHSMTRRQLQELVNSGELVSMKQHRSEKARHLKKIKKLRAATRQRTRLLIEGGKAIATHAKGLMIDKIDRVATTRNELELSNNRLGRFYLSFYHEAFISFEAFQKEFFNKTERAYIVEDESLYMSIALYYDQKFDTQSRSAIDQLNLEQQGNVLLSLI